MSQPEDGERPPARGRGIKPFVSVKAHWPLAVKVAAAVVLAGLPVVWVKGKAQYSTSAAIRVSPSFAANLKQDEELKLPSNTQYRQFVQHQVQTITRYDILEAALKSLGADRGVWQQPGESDQHAIERLAWALSVKPIPDTYLITVGLDGPRKDGLAEIVNAVVDAYLARSREEEVWGSDVRISNLEKRADEILASVRERVERQNELAQELGVAIFTDKFQNPYDRAVSDGKEALAAARRQRIEADAQLAAILQKLQKLDALEVRPRAEEVLRSDRSFGDFKAGLLQRRGNLFIELGALASEHPGRAGVEQEIRAIDAEIERGTAATMARIEATLHGERAVDTGKAKADAQAAVDQAVLAEKALEDLDRKAEERASWFATKYAEGTRLGEEITRERGKLDEVYDRVDFLKLELRAPGFVRLASPARTPEAPTKGGRKGLFLVAVGAALALGVATTVAVDLIDRRLHTPGDLQNLVGFPPLGWLLADGQPGASAFAHDQLRRLALAVDRERRHHGTRTLVITSPKPRGGSTTLVLELARELCDIGVQAVALEANPFHPDPRYALPGETLGLIGVLDGVVPLADAVRPASGRLPDRLPIGEAAEDHLLVHADGLARLLAELGKRYAVVLVDTAPLLLSADTELTIELAGAVLLNVDAGGVLKPEVLRASAALQRLAPPVVGAVLTRVKAFDGGGYFGELAREYESSGGAPGLGAATRPSEVPA